MAKRYCGNCGEILSKKKQICPDCEISIKEFKKPYNKMTSQMKIAIWFFIFASILYLTLIAMVIINNVPHSPSIYITMFFLPAFAIYATIKTRALVKNGFKKCRKCDHKSSLNANYCIYCGKKIKWSSKW